MRNMILMALGLFILALGSCGQNGKKGYDFVHEVSDIQVDENVVYGKLPNGVRYAILQNDTPTKTASLRVRVATGSFNETDEQRGLAHFIEHMAFNGSKNIPEGEMIKRLERFGLAFGADTNAYTSFDETVYTLDLPEVSEDILDETFMIMRETMENLTMDEAAIDRERGVVQAEKRRGDSPSARASRARLKFMTQGSRISKRLPIGTDETLKTMKRDTFLDYYHKFYRPENTFVVFVGDVEPSHVQEKLSKYFADWHAVGEAGKQLDAGVTPPRGQDVGYFTDPEIQTMVTIATINPFKDYEDTAANRKKGFIERLGTRILNRRLSRLARKADAEFISAGASWEFSEDSADIMGISATSRPENWKKALAVIDQELRKALKYGFTEDELKEQLANSRKSLEVAVQTAQTRRTSGLAQGILGAFAAENVYSTPAATLERYNSYAGDITLEEVWAAFKKQWKGVEKPLIYLQTSEILEKPEAEILAAFDDSRAIKVQKDEAKDIGKFAYTDFGKPGKVKSEKYVKDVDAYLITFGNNVRLNVKKTDFEKDTIRISVRVGDGSLSMPRKSGALSILASNMMAAGGLKAHSVDDIQKLMAGKAVGAGFSIGTQSFIISGSTVPSDLTDQFNLMMANLIAPGFRDEAVARYHKYIESWYPTLDSTPGGVAARDVGRLIRSGDPRYGIPAQEELLGADPEEVKSWINTQLKDGPIEITVVGDIDKDEIIKQVARTFGTLKTRKTDHQKYPEMTKLVFPEKRRKIVTLNHSGDGNRALVKVFWKAPDGSDTLRNRRLNVLRRIFENRLTDVIREEEGLAYSPSAGIAGSRIFKDYGYISASAGLKPGKAALMLVKLEQISTNLMRGNISQDEFTRAIKPILENLDNSLESNGFWMSTLSDAQSDAYGLKGYRTREEQYKAMKLEDLKPLAADIFKRENAYKIEILPQK